jgi:CRP-like cAMP-binding protein
MNQMTEELKEYINRIHKLPDDLLKDFLSYWQIKYARRKEVITHEGNTERFLYFTKKGIQKAYYLKEGKHYIIAFTYPFAFTCIPESFLTQTPSKYYFECITDSEFLFISYNSFITLVEKHHEIETLLRKTLIGTLSGIVNRYHRILTLSMEEKSNDFMQTSLHLINQIPHKDIANYLKIDPTNFSRLLSHAKF